MAGNLQVARLRSVVANGRFHRQSQQTLGEVERTLHRLPHPTRPLGLFDFNLSILSPVRLKREAPFSPSSATDCYIGLLGPQTTDIDTNSYLPARCLLLEPFPRVRPAESNHCRRII